MGIGGDEDDVATEKARDSPLSFCSCTLLRMDWHDDVASGSVKDIILVICEFNQD